ncbi:MAG: DNA-binding transcriptional regulator [Kiritimatiellae bacterium]|nr:DNA-binding transcriptional regulator [Kiritimatiellia bacterium]
MDAARRHIALIVETSNAYARGILRGIRRYIREHEPWAIYLGEHSRGAVSAAWLKGWHGDGVIARVENERIAEAVRACGLPAVDVSAARLIPELPWVETDDRAIADAAADHLLARGFRHFGFCGDEHFNWSKWRRERFVQRLREAGFGCRVHPVALQADTPSDWAREQGRMAAWVAGLPRPAGVLACYDICGQRLLQACRQAGVAVPYEVAVVGVDNDELVCDLSDPPLSSVIPDTGRTGYQAAALLDRILAGAKTGPAELRIAPLGIAERQSSDLLAIEDREISRAIRAIRDNAHRNIRVRDVLANVPLSRRVFEARFRQATGLTPHQEIVRVRLARIRQLLLETDLSLPAIAERAGFEHPEYMSVFFKRETGMSLSRYRATAGR